MHFWRFILTRIWARRARYFRLYQLMLLDKALSSVSLTDMQANICTNASLLERKQGVRLFSLAAHKAHSQDQHLRELEWNYCNTTGIKCCTENSNSPSCSPRTRARGASPLRNCWDHENITFCQKASGRSHDLKSSSVLCSQNLGGRNGKKEEKVKSSAKNCTFSHVLQGIGPVWMWVCPLLRRRCNLSELAGQVWSSGLVWVVVKSDTFRTCLHILAHTDTLD